MHVCPFVNVSLCLCSYPFNAQDGIFKLPHNLLNNLPLQPMPITDPPRSHSAHIYETRSKDFSYHTFKVSIRINISTHSFPIMTPSYFFLKKTKHFKV